MPNALMDQSQPLDASQMPQDASAAPDASQGPGAAPDASAAPPDDPNQPGTDPAAATTPTLASAGIDPEVIKDAIHKASVVDAKLSKILDSSTGGKVERAKVISAMVEIVADGIMSPAGAASFMTDIPEEPTAIREWVQKHATEAQTGLAHLMFALHGSAPDDGGAPPDQGEALPDQGEAPPEEQQPQAA